MFEQAKACFQRKTLDIKYRNHPDPFSLFYRSCRVPKHIHICHAEPDFAYAGERGAWKLLW